MYFLLKIGIFHCYVSLPERIRRIVWVISYLCHSELDRSPTFMNYESFQQISCDSSGVQFPLDVGFPSYSTEGKGGDLLVVMFRSKKTTKGNQAPHKLEKVFSTMILLDAFCCQTTLPK